MMESKIENLHIDISNSPKLKTKAKRGKVDDIVDSWEDDEFSSPTSSEIQTPTEGSGPSLKPVKSRDPALNPPPPTPISPNNGTGYVDWSPAAVLGGGRPQLYPSSASSTSPPTGDQEKRRPEKTTATAGRMIAASLGMKAPKKTEEQRQYDRSIKEQEIKRRNREKEEQERQRQEDEKQRQPCGMDELQ